MRETIEFRIPETDAVRYLPADAGVRLGIARKIEVQPDDPLFGEIGRIDRQLRAEGKGGLFTAWLPHRRYSRRELSEARLLRLTFKTVFEPAGEECGTHYDETTACPLCGAGARQVTPLFLDGRRLPSRNDFATSIAGELVVSSRVVELFEAHGLQGARFDAVRLSNRDGEASRDWHQIQFVSQPVDVDSATRVGRDPFNHDEGADRCPRGDLLAYSLLSEVSVGHPHGASDVVKTKQFFGVRRGLLRPQPLVLVSPKAWSAFENGKLKGYRAEVAHLV